MRVPFDVAAVRRDFMELGAVILPGFFDARRLKPIVAAVDEHWKQSDKSPLRHSDFDRFETYPTAWGPVAEANPLFLTLRDDPDLVALTRAAIGSDFTHGVDLVMYTGKGKGQAWHQDCPPDDLSKFTVNRLIYVRDVDPAQGALVYVPGSHKFGRIPPGGNQDPMPGEVHLSPRAGTVAIMNSLCYHRVTANQLNEPRVSINFRVQPPNVAQDYDKVAAFRGGTYDFRTEKVLDQR